MQNDSKVNKISLGVVPCTIFIDVTTWKPQEESMSKLKEYIISYHDSIHWSAGTWLIDLVTGNMLESLAKQFEQQGRFIAKVGDFHTNRFSFVCLFLHCSHSRGKHNCFECRKPHSKENTCTIFLRWNIVNIRDQKSLEMFHDMIRERYRDGLLWDYNPVPCKGLSVVLV